MAKPDDDQHKSFVDEIDPWFADRINRARQGDEQALGELVQHYRGYLEYVANQFMDTQLKAKLGASDLVQESLVNVNGHVRDFRGSSPQEFKFWIRRIVQNEMNNTRRKFVDAKSRQVDRETRLNDSALPVPLLADTQNTPSTEALSREKASALQSAMATLPDDYQTVLRLRNWQELPFEEIGRQMNISDEAARKLWYRALMKLQKTVDKEFPDLRSGIIEAGQ